MPKLWSATIEAHQREVRDATLDAAAALVAEHGLLSVTMSQVAQVTGVGRATLYKYFSDVTAILIAWHERHVARHFEHLHDVGSRASGRRERLAAVLEAYAMLIYDRPHDNELAALVHRGEHFAKARRRLNHLIRDLLIDAAKDGDIRVDVAPDELVNYCFHALSASSELSSKSAVRRLVGITMSGLREVSRS